MGTFLVKRDGTLRGAIDAFGTPGDRDRRRRRRFRTVRWLRHGLRIDFYNLGGRRHAAPPRVLFRRPCPWPPLADESRDSLSAIADGVSGTSTRKRNTTAASLASGRRDGGLSAGRLGSAQEARIPAF